MKDKKIIIIVTIIVVVIMISILIGIVVHKSKTKNNTKTKPVEYTCKDGYRLYNQSCIKEIESLMPKVTYSCKDGYELNKDKCIKYEKQEPTVTWNCPSGFSKSDNKEPSLCVRTSTEAISILSYYCPYGYNLNGTSCTTEKVTPAKILYSCSGNSMYNESIGLCQLFAAPTSCPSNMWTYENHGPYKTCVNYPTIQYHCPENARLVGTSCITPGQTISATPVTGCRQGFKMSSDRKTCTKTEYEVPTYQLHCSEGYNLDNNTCVKKIFSEAYKKYSCEKGYSLISEKCVKYEKLLPIKKES